MLLYQPRDIFKQCFNLHNSYIYICNNTHTHTHTHGNSADGVDRKDEVLEHEEDEGGGGPGEEERGGRDGGAGEEEEGEKNVANQVEHGRNQVSSTLSHQGGVG